MYTMPSPYSGCNITYGDETPESIACDNAVEQDICAIESAFKLIKYLAVTNYFWRSKKVDNDTRKALVDLGKSVNEQVEVELQDMVNSDQAEDILSEWAFVFKDELCDFDDMPSPDEVDLGLSKETYKAQNKDYRDLI